LGRDNTASFSITIARTMVLSIIVASVIFVGRPSPRTLLRPGPARSNHSATSWTGCSPKFGGLVSQAGVSRIRPSKVSYPSARWQGWISIDAHGAWLGLPLSSWVGHDLLFIKGLPTRLLASEGQGHPPRSQYTPWPPGAHDASTLEAVKKVTERLLPHSGKRTKRPRRSIR